MNKRRNFRFDDATETKLQSLMIAWDLDATGVLKRLIAEAKTECGIATARAQADGAEKRPRSAPTRRTKTNATIAPRPLPPEPELRANALRRRIPKPA